MSLFEQEVGCGLYDVMLREGKQVQSVHFPLLKKTSADNSWEMISSSFLQFAPTCGPIKCV
jgi:hypothetical protein